MTDVQVIAAALPSPEAPDACLRGGGDMGARMRAFDWQQTPLGAVAQWPQSLKTAVQIMLNSRYPMFVWWGHEFTNLYNDAYAPILGQRHPQALGQAASRIWMDVWDVVGPQAMAVLYEGQASWNEDLLLIMERYGYPEETYFTFSYSPVANDGEGVGGVFCAVTEETARVLGQRRLRTLRDLATATVRAKDAVEACQHAASALRANPYDLPFALLYLCEATGTQAQLAGTAGVSVMGPEVPATIDLQPEAQSLWPLWRVTSSREPLCLDDLVQQVGVMPGGPWPAPPSQALLLPLAQAGQEQLAGILIAGVSPYRPLDEEYHDFLHLVATSVATAIADARAFEAERQRAAALVELDRAKTAFVSNVSHEFRTPLTLIMGPLEQILTGAYGTLSSSLAQELEVVHHNGLRLLKLVNTLLDFARLEAGRLEAFYEPLDLAAFTADLASAFRSAIEGVGLRLVVHCPPLPEMIYVDRDMWEKIVFNLLSNALKFTFDGEIAVGLHWQEKQVALTVRDTGTGIPAAELPYLFKRFHRIRDARARTHEGLGIGLALVQELVHLHGGSITVDSVLGAGTTFTVTLPAGKAHLPGDRVGSEPPVPSTVRRADSYVVEAMRWLPAASEYPLIQEGTSAPVSWPPSTLPPARLLVVDDNADMRAYLQRLLSPVWQVEVAANGEQALCAARERRPDLVLTDVMMPGRDGFALLQALRADPHTATLPVILLSARAGEEARVTGLAAGADDYLVKPFAARELLARIEVHLKLAHLRHTMQAAVRESEVRFRTMADHAPVMIWVTEPDGTCTYLNTAWYAFTGHSSADALGFGWIDAIHPEDRASARQTFLAANSQQSAFRLEYRLRRHDGVYRWVIDAASPRRGPQGEFLGYIGSVLDITEHKQAEEILRQAHATLEQRVAERTAALEQALAERQRLEREAQRAEHFALLGRLAAGVSHELRNPLAAVFLHVDLLQEELAQPSPESSATIAEALTAITTHLGRVDDLMQDYLSLVRVHTIQCEPQDLGKAVQAWGHEFTEVVEASGVQLRVEGMETLGSVAFHASTLRRALLNLVQNAAEAMPQSGTIFLRGYRTATQVQLEVQDTGNGIPEEKQARIFEPLYTTKPGGTGLGLYIVQEIAAAHGGKVTVRSTEGQGTTMTLTLPCENLAATSG